MAKSIRCIPAFILIGSLIAPRYVGAETVRARAERRFSAFDWVQDADSLPAVARDAQTLPGAMETLVVLDPPSSTALFPILEGIGSLDYSRMDDALIVASRSFAAGLSSRALSPELCASDRRFLAAVTTFRLSRLPEVSSVYFSCQQVSALEGANSGAESDSPQTVPLSQTATVLFRVNLKQAKDSAHPGYLVLSALFSGSGGAWLVSDVSFVGSDYAKFIKSN